MKVIKEKPELLSMQCIGDCEAWAKIESMGSFNTMLLTGDSAGKQTQIEFDLDGAEKFALTMLRMVEEKRWKMRGGSTQDHDFVSPVETPGPNDLCRLCHAENQHHRAKQENTAPKEILVQNHTMQEVIIKIRDGAVAFVDRQSRDRLVRWLESLLSHKQAVYDARGLLNNVKDGY